MKITFIDDEPEIWPLQYGGKARTIVTLAESLAKRADIESVKIISRSITSEREHFSHHKVEYLKTGNYDVIGKILKATAGSDIVSVHACSFTFPLITDTKAKIIYNLHDVIFATSDAGSHLDKAMASDWSAIISPSEYASTVLGNLSFWSNLKDRIITIPRALDTNNFSPKNKAEAIKIIHENGYLKNIELGDYPIILFPNRPEIKKGGNFLESIYEKLAKSYKNLKIIVTSDAGNLKSKNVCYTDWIPTHLMKYFYSISDIVINFSSLPESFSQVSVESVACGTPVLCFRFGNLAHLSDQIPAIYCCPPETSAIIDSIDNILTDNQIDKSKIIDSIQTVRNKFNLSSITDRYVSNYLNLINGTSPCLKSENQIKQSDRFFFASPMLAQYKNVVYIPNKSGIIKKIVIDPIGKNLLKYSSNTVSFDKLSETTGLDKATLQNKLDQLCSDEIIIRI